MKSFSSRIIGFSKIAIHLTWILIGFLGIIYILKGFVFIEDATIENLNIVNLNIDVLKGLLNESIDVIETVDQSISTIEQSSIDAGLGLVDSRPMISKTSQVVTQDLPIALDEVQTSMPSLMNAAAMIDQTLYLLSRFRFNIPVPFGNDIEVSLGVDYNPEIPLEDAFIQLSGNLEGIPQQMRSLKGDLDIANNNLGVMSENLIDIAYDLDLIREQVADIIPEFQEIIINLETIQSSIEKTIERFPKNIRIARNVLISLIVLMILGQIPSMYIGYLLTREEFVQPNQIKENHSHSGKQTK